jgi:hypothetical protein
MQFIDDDDDGWSIIDDDDCGIPRNGAFLYPITPTKHANAAVNGCELLLFTSFQTGRFWIEIALTHLRIEV